MIKPTIGRQVWFRGFPWDADGRNAGKSPIVYDQSQPLAATVVYVWNDRLVNVDIIDHAGVHWFMSSVPLQQPEDAPIPFAHVEWMPFQVGQAKTYPEPSPNQP